MELTHAPARDRARTLMSRLPEPVLLGGLVAAIVALNLWWLELESRPPQWETARHLRNSLLFLHGFSLSDPTPFLTGYLYYPPVVYWVTDVFYAAFGSEATTVAVLSSVVWLAVLVFSTFALGKRLWSARVGWLSVAFVVTAPMVVGASKQYTLVLPLTAMAALCLYLLIRADGFASRRFSLLFGIATGLGLLVGWTLLLVLVLPFVQASAVALAEARQQRAFSRLAHLGAATALAFGIAAIWYVPNLVNVLSRAPTFNGPEAVVQGEPPRASLESATWYLWNLLDTQLYLGPFLLVLVGLAFCVGKREIASRNLYPLLTIVGTYVLFTLLRHKEARNTLPMLPALAVVATSWLEYVSARARKWVIGAFAVYGTAAFLVISFGISFLPKQVAVDLPSTGGAGPEKLVAFAQHGDVTGPPTDEDWHEAEAVRSLTAAPADDRTFTYEGPDTMWVNAYGLQYYGLRYDADLVSAGPAYFLVYRGPLPSVPPGFVERRRWTLPDGSELVTYERSGAR